MTANIQVPPVLNEVLRRDDAALFVSISGGKDSQAMLATLARLHQTEGWRCALYAIHADLGRAEWPESRPHCERLCQDLGIWLQVVRRPQGDLVQEIQDRMAKLSALPEKKNPWPTATMRYCTADQKRDQLQKAKKSPFWPDAQNRYCTADQKRTQIDKAVRAPFWPSAASRYCTAHHKQNQIDTALRGYSLVVSAMGMRAQESRARAKKQAFKLDQDLTAKRYQDLAPAVAMQAWKNLGKGRLAFEWLPIHGWQLDSVWEACGTSAPDLAHRQNLYRLGLADEALDGWPAHPAYVFGNERVSCALCVLASENDLRVGARHNPELFLEYLIMEHQSGCTFQNGKPLARLTMSVPVVLQGRQIVEAR